MISTARAVLGAAMLIVATAAATAIVLSKWDNLFPPTDYEGCAERAATTAKSKDALAILVSTCNSKFVGRRKPTGGYTYFDGRQTRNFDIAGPNPTSEEWRSIEAEYSKFIEAQRAEETRQAEERRRAAIAQASFENQQRQANLELEKRRQQALADFERRRLAAVPQVHVLTVNVECVFSMTCQTYKLTVKIRNDSSETISAVSFGWAFTAEDPTCPSTLATKTQERINLRPGDTAVLNLDGYDGPSYRDRGFYTCVKVLDAQLALLQ